MMKMFTVCRELQSTDRVRDERKYPDEFYSINNVAQHDYPVILEGHEVTENHQRWTYEVDMAYGALVQVEHDRCYRDGPVGESEWDTSVSLSIDACTTSKSPTDLGLMILEALRHHEKMGRVPK